MIAECKKASPSIGLMRENYQPAALALGFERVGAAAISVLTDEDFFRGSLADLTAVSDSVKTPVLRKDFILDSFQILEARGGRSGCHPADRSGARGPSAARLSKNGSRAWLDVLCEAHSREEVDRAVNLGFEVIG